ncbi:uncharacterized protein LOC112270935 [Brachypodium distachyon]|uniref:AIPP2-like SPOC-like domain-containing protein n=1 Tax=Brachypodium distachyon TaxID=15368 RepID=A0A0Q3IDJ1_BRADI|nr:uncharacterized protein LOC112270935 [Brachypodium distachyon]XP_024315385.1 uncharacterized protein LOC112270935 [Brachypodium distachyon]KQK03971.2 hypothetical protein BRADI_2g10930v3 [Brachypodium distachyon]|eukprot:XP_024315384.1 uncharacterized protein LOC112270935 [Brachypodium distachyon]
MGNRRQNYGRTFGPRSRKPSREKTIMWKRCVNETKKTKDFFRRVSFPNNSRVVVQARRPLPSGLMSNKGTVCSQKNIKKSRPRQSHIEKPRLDNVRACPSNNFENPKPSFRGLNNRLVSLQKNTELSSRLNKAQTSSPKNTENPKPSSSSLGTERMPMPKDNEVPRSSVLRLNNGMVPQPRDNDKPRTSRLPGGFSSGKLEKLGFIGSKVDPDSESHISKKVHPSSMVHNSRNAEQMASVHVQKENQVIQNHRCNLGGNSFPKIGKELCADPMMEASSMGNNMELNATLDHGLNDDEFKRKRTDPLLEEKLETPMKRTKPHEDHDSEKVENCKLVKRRRIYKYEDDDDDDQNLVGVEGGTGALITQTALVKSTKVLNPLVSESIKVQQHSDLPIDEPIWSGVFKTDNKEYVPLAAHLSVKHCEKVWKISRSLQPKVEVTKLSRLEAWPKSFETSRPTDDNIALYFLPQELRQDAHLDQLVQEVIENDMVLRAVVGEAEMLIFPSVLLPERHQTFKGKHYLWAVFKRIEAKVATPTLHEEQHRIGSCAREEEKHASPRIDGHQVTGLNMRVGLEAPEEAERQVKEKEQTPSTARPNAPRPAEGAARSAPTPTMPTAVPANNGQIISSFGVPTGALFGFISGQTPRLEQLIKEMRSEGALVIAMRGEIIGSGLGQATAK